MDFLDRLLVFDGKDKIFVVVDRLTKYAHFIVSDRDAKFKGNFWKDLCHQAGISLNMSSAYHPQTDGQTEAVNKCLETYLRFFVTDKQNKWFQWLHLEDVDLG